LNLVQDKSHKNIMPTKAQKSLENLRLKLIDLTIRNRLLNFHHTKHSYLRVIDECPDQLVKCLRTGKKMEFIAGPDPTRSQLVQKKYLGRRNGVDVQPKAHPTAEIWAKELNLDVAFAVPQFADSDEEKHQDLKIQTVLYAHELSNKGEAIVKRSRLAIIEKGAKAVEHWLELDGGNA
jgi:hypothetical protein